MVQKRIRCKRGLSGRGMIREVILDNRYYPSFLVNSVSMSLHLAIHAQG